VNSVSPSERTQPIVALLRGCGGVQEPQHVQEMLELVFVLSLLMRIPLARLRLG